MDGTSWRGIGSSREGDRLAAEPAMLMVAHAGADRRLDAALHHRRIHGFAAGRLRVSLGSGLLGLVMVAVAEIGRIPIDNPATYSSSPWCMAYGGRHLALIELSSSLKLFWCRCSPVRTIENAGAAVPALAIGIGAYVGKLAVGGFLLGLFETSIAKMRVFRVEFLAPP